MSIKRYLQVTLLGIVAGCAVPEVQGSDLDLFPLMGKADTPITVEVPFEVSPQSTSEYSIRNCGQLAVEFNQDSERSNERVRLIVDTESYRRRSWRWWNPSLTAPRPPSGCETARITVENETDEAVFGALLLESEVPPELGLEFHANEPDCDGCSDPSGGARESLVTAILSARRSIDIAIFGIDDPAIIDALCHVIGDGVEVRVLGDDNSEDEDNIRGYYAALYSSDGLEACGAQVEVVRNSGLMHHKFVLIDAGDPDELLITGSMNFTDAGLDTNHNHLTYLRGFPEITEAYLAEFDQLYNHCAVDRQDDRQCDECTPSCTEDRSEEGPWRAHESEVSVYFAPSDNALTAIRGEARSERVDSPDPSCADPASNCVCRRAGERWNCSYCALGEDGFGLLEQARERVTMSMYAATDQCLAMGMARAYHQGAEVMTVWDFVQAANPYSRDDYLCGEGIPVHLSRWGGGSPLIRNHNKLLVIDDVVIDGSLNLSNNGIRQNNENTLVIRNRNLADQINDYIHSEVQLLNTIEAPVGVSDYCLCADLIDNDHDGLVDDEDDDCDGGALPPEDDD